MAATQKVVSVDLSYKRSQSTNVLQIINPNVLEVIENAAHVVTYNFEAGKWEKGNCEGACFLTKNCVAPYHSVIILNKMGIENFTMNLANIQNMKLQAPYVMIKYLNDEGTARIVGLWFHDEQERAVFFEAMEVCINGNSKRKSPVPSAVLSTSGAISDTKTGMLKNILTGAATASSDNSKSTTSSESKINNSSQPKKASNKTLDTNSKGKVIAQAAVIQPLGGSVTPLTRANDSTVALKNILFVSNTNNSCANASGIDEPANEQRRARAKSQSPLPASKAVAPTSSQEMEALTTTRYGPKEDMFTDRGISSVQIRAQFEAPKGIDSSVAIAANESYRQATKGAAKAEACIPAHHLQAGGVGSAFFFDESPGASLEALHQAPATSVAEKPAYNKTALLKSLLATSGSATNATTPITTEKTLNASTRRASTPASYIPASMLSPASSVNVVPDSSPSMSKDSPPEPTKLALPMRRSSESLLSPSDLMKLMSKKQT